MRWRAARSKTRRCIGRSSRGAWGCHGSAVTSGRWPGIGHEIRVSREKTACNAPTSISAVVAVVILPLCSVLVCGSHTRPTGSSGPHDDDQVQLAVAVNVGGNRTFSRHTGVDVVALELTARVVRGLVEPQTTPAGPPASNDLRPQNPPSTYSGAKASAALCSVPTPKPNSGSQVQAPIELHAPVIAIAVDLMPGVAGGRLGGRRVSGNSEREVTDRSPAARFTPGIAAA